MRNLYLLLIFVSSFPLLINAQNPDIELDLFATGLNGVTDIANAGDSRLFIVEQAGTIKIVNDNGSVNPVPFLDITSLIENSGNEQGLLGLTFHPNYNNNGYFYVNYTALPNGETHISRFSVSATDSNVADPNSELVILTQSQPFANHNAGALHFGPDGYLYFGLGDGGSAGDPQENAQDGTTLLGKMIRIDVDGGTPYAIPLTNPFISNINILDEIWALGVRNPFRFSFDRTTGDMWIADVGQNDWEEINFEPASSTGGMNWGWDCYEGNHPFELTGCAAITSYDFPIFEYPNDQAHGCAVLGGYVYRGTDYPNLEGHYLLTDLCSGRLWTVFPDGSGGWDTTDQGQMTTNSFTTFGEGNDGELYIAERTGDIFKITTAGVYAENLDKIGYSFLPAVPNPFNNETLIRYELQNSMDIEVAIMDIMGRKVNSLENGNKNAGVHELYWDGSSASGHPVEPGIYFIVLDGEGAVVTQKVTYIR